MCIRDSPDDVDQSFVKDIFTSFRKYCEKNVLVREIVEPTFSFSKENLINDHDNKLPTLNDLGLNNYEMDSRTAFPFSGGCLSAKARLNYYLWESKKVSFYKKTRNGLLGKDSSSKFSAWLANGSISLRKNCSISVSAFFELSVDSIVFICESSISNLSLFRSPVSFCNASNSFVEFIENNFCSCSFISVSYTHLTLPTNREV